MVDSQNHVVTHSKGHAELTPEIFLCKVLQPLAGRLGDPAAAGATQ